VDNIVGDGPRSIASYTATPAICILPPSLFKIAFDDSPPPKAGDLLFGLITEFKTRVESEEFEVTDIEDAWFDKMVWLYLVAKGLSKPVRLVWNPRAIQRRERST
jgi:hypothetical protein